MVNGTALSVQTGGQEVANAFNQHFATVGEKIALSVNSEGIVESETNEMEGGVFLKVSEEEVIKAMDSIKGGSSPGFDRVTIQILKRVQQHVIKPLTYLVNRSFADNVFPDVYKKAIIIPVFKKGDPKNLDNYRPISLLSVVSKIIEKIAKRYLVSFIEDNDILSENQFGFRTGRSTDDAIAFMTKQISCAMDKGKKVIGV